MGLHTRTHVIQLPAGERRSPGYANKLSIDYSVRRKRRMLGRRKRRLSGAGPAAHAAAL